MLVFRSLTLGLLGACVLLLAQLRPAPHVHVVTTLPASHAVATPPPPSAPTIINIGTKECDLGSGMFATCFATDLQALLQLAPGERVTAVGDQAIDASALASLARANGVDYPDTLLMTEAATALALWNAPKEKGRYLDLTVASARGERRVLVLMH